MKKDEQALYVDKYIYRVEWSEEDEAFVGTCVEFPSLSSVEKNQADALKEIVQVVKASVEWMVEDGEKVPEPLKLREYSGRTNLRMSPELHRQAFISASESGVSLNSWIVGKISS